jgi:integrase
MSELFELHYVWLRAGGCSESTIRDRRGLLGRADRALPHGVDNAHTSEVARFMANRAWRPWTRNGYFRHLNGYYEWAVEAGELSMNPMTALRCPPEGERLPNPVTNDQLAHLLEVTAQGYWRHPWRLAILLAAYAGLRVSDIATLDRCDITEDRIHIRHGKGGRGAFVVTHPLVWNEVADLPPGPVVRDRNGRPVTAYQLTNRAWYAFRRWGLPGVHMHLLRHWHATALLEAGADLETVRQCMRHRSIVSTVGYTRVVSQRRRDAVHSLPLAERNGPGASGPVPPTAYAA